MKTISHNNRDIAGGNTDLAQIGFIHNEYLIFKHIRCDRHKCCLLPRENNSNCYFVLKCISGLAIYVDDGLLVTVKICCSHL